MNSYYPHPSQTTGQRRLRAALLVVCLLYIPAVLADWRTAAWVLLGTLVLLLGVSVTWEYLTRRHWDAQRKPFEQDADEFLRELFGDKPPQ